MRKLILKIIILLILLFFFVLMLKISFNYLDLDTNSGFLRIKQWTIRKYTGLIGDVWLVSFFIHALTSIFALIAGFTQFSKIFMRNKWHRFFGKFYIVTVLFLSAPTGFIMSFFANGGLTSILGFLILSILWIYTTTQAYIYVKRKDYTNHSKWMYRSYALALSAITLRIYKYAYVNWIDPDMTMMGPMDLYRIIAWMGWVPNLIIAEILIFKKNHLKLLSYKN